VRKKEWNLKPDFKFLSLLFGENFKERDFKPADFKFPPIIKELELPHL